MNSTCTSVRTQGQDRACYVVNPRHFSPQLHLPPELQRHAEPVRYLIHRIYCRYAYMHSDAYVFLAAKDMRTFFTDRRAYKRSIDHLAKIGAVDRNRSYVIGEQTMSFRPGPLFASSRPRQVPLTDPRLVAKVLDHRASKPIARPPTDPTLRYLFDGPCRMDFDYPSALEALLAECTAGDPWCDGLFHNEIRIQAVRDRKFTWSLCRHGRFHNTIANLKKTMRPFLSAGGRPMWSLDVRNSQPMFFALDLRDQYAAAGQAMPADVGLFLDLCEAGAFYEHLMQGDGPEERNAVKASILVLFFCEAWQMGTARGRAFQAAFPTVHTKIREAKAGDYRRLAWDLQRRESDFMVRRVAARLARELPDAVVGSIYDEFLVDHGSAAAVLEVMKDEFSALGVHPQIRARELVRPPSISQDA